MSREQGNLSIDSENIFPIIKKWLYSDHDIFIRELVSNGCDAITKLKKLDLISEVEIPEGYKSPYEDSLGVKTGFVEINNIWTTVQNKQWNWAAPMYRGMLDSWSRQGVGLPVTDDTLAIKVAKILGEFVDKHPDVITKLVHDEADQAEYADLKTVIKTYVQESNTRFIVGELPLSEWDEHIETLNDMGMERFVELTQKAYENANMN